MTGAEMPTILAFDTSGKHCAAALLVRDRLVADRFEPMERGQAERLFPLLDELLANAGTTWADLDAIAVGVGPGNFTGIRISVAAARGLALSLGVPAIGITTFEIAVAAADPEGSKRLTGTVRLPGPRETFYAQEFDAGRPAGPASVSTDRDATGLAEGFDWSRDHGHHWLARIAAGKLRSDSGHPRPSPLYIRPADAAPAKDSGPVILP